MIAETATERVDPDVARFTELDTNCLALIAAMVELIEPSQNQTAHTREIAAYASRRFAYSEDPIADLETLHARGMIGLATNARLGIAR